jgi:hypothetical protein
MLTLNHTVPGEEMLTPEKKKALRGTVVGGAMSTARLARELPESGRLAVALHLLNGPLFDLVCFTDPDVTSLSEWKNKAKDISNQLMLAAKKLQSMAE